MDRAQICHNHAIGEDRHCFCGGRAIRRGFATQFATRGNRFCYPSSLSSLSAASRCMPGVTWLYKSMVSVILECPKRS
jgi:hypothetical protein